MIQEIVNKWLEGAKKDLFKNYIKLGLKASGDWGDSLESKSQVTPTKIKASISANDYTVQLEEGRKPNRNQNPVKLKAWVGWAGSTFLKDWVKNKGINVNPYAAAWKIAKEGWKIPNKYNKGGLVSDVITDDRIKSLVDELVGFKVSEVRSDIIRRFRRD
jgi:hypothetical protein